MDKAMDFFQLLLLSFMVINNDAISVKKKICSSSRSNTPCVFPYLLNGSLRFECTTRGPLRGDLFGKCPLKLLNENTREVSMKVSDWAKCNNHCPFREYKSNQELGRHLAGLAAEFPDIAQFIVIGNSTLGQPLNGIRITRGVNQDRDNLKPMFRYSGNMHGNEPVGREMLSHFAEVLVRSYGVDPRLTRLVNVTDITIIPTINPDGWDRAEEGQCSGTDYKTGRYNEGDRDLNRDFPTWREKNKSKDFIYLHRQPETRAMMDLILGQPWVLSANFHDGAVVASYPYDDYRDSHTAEKGVHPTPDHDFFKHLASTYATNHETMLNQSVCTKWFFHDGITNGADWYPLQGGMQDFNYIFTNDFEITLELSCCKYPNKYYLNREWDYNRESIIAYLEQVHRGVKGMVRDSSGSPVSGAVVSVTDSGSATARGKTVKSSSRGEFWRLLLPGTYTLRAEVAGCGGRDVKVRSGPVEVVITENKPLLVKDIVIANCSNGPR